MDTHIIKMPDIGEGIAEVEIVEWHVSVGDTVVEDQVLADVMTDKASVEIPSPIAGSVVSLGGQVGDVLAVGSELITLRPQQAASDTAQTAAASAAESAPQPEPDITQTALQTQDTAESLSDAAQSAQSAQQTGTNPGAGQLIAGGDAATDSPRRTGSQANANAAVVSSSQSHGRADSEQTPLRSQSKVLASPSVRQRARHLDIDLRDLAQGAGDTPVSHRDLDEYLMSQYSPERGAAAAASKHVSQDSVSRWDDAGDASARGDTQIKVIGLRRQIAVKMQESKRQIPHFSYVEEIDVTELENLRRTLNDEQGQDGERLTLLPFLVRAMVQAVQRFPEVNAHYDSENGMVTQFGAVHMGIATQTENGLMVPVLRNAQSLDIWEYASEIKRLTSLTRRGKAQRDHLTGSTLTLSSLGPLGGIAATPIINHPEVAIVGVNRIIERPVFQNGQLVARKTMNLSSSFDHRIVDGMNAALFIQEIKRLLESPVLLFVRATP